MTKSILLALGALFLGTVSSKAFESEQNDLKDYNLQGHVKTVSTVDYQPVKKGKDWVSGNKITATQRAFNKDGFVVEEIIRGPKSQLLYTSNFQLIGKSKLVEYRQFNENGGLQVYEKGKLDKDGNIVTMNSYTPSNKLISYVKSNFNAIGQIMQTYYYNADNSLINSKEFSYDNNARLSFIKYKIKNGDDYVEFYEYDKEGLLILQKNVDMEGHVTSLTQNEYVNKLKVKSIYHPVLMNSKEHQITLYETDGSIKEQEYRNHQDQVIRKEVISYFVPGKLFKTEVYEMLGQKLCKSYTIQYDQYNNEIYREFYDISEKPTDQVTTEYKFDDHNNWIEKREIEKGKTISIQKREITYFE